MGLDLIDIGSNLTHDSFAADRDAVMARALQAGVRRQIVTGADMASSHQAAALAVDSRRASGARPACIRIMRNPFPARNPKN